MSAGYQVVTWTPFKKTFDLVMLASIAVFMTAFVVASYVTWPDGETLHPVQLALRAAGFTAFAMLHVVLAIGPLARLSPRFKPLLYNRRHLGVATFLVALAHAGLALMWYHGFAEVNVFVSLFASNPNYDSIQRFPFESLGVVALIILFLMAATSHDFWNANLGPTFWKALHMCVYAAYATLVAHVMLGVVQSEKSPFYAYAVLAGAGLLAGLHLFTGAREWMKDRALGAAAADGWVEVGAPDSIPDGRAVIVVLKSGERVAVFRYDGKVSAVSNVCRHQAGPLGEGCVLDGLVTCPWHGFQYRPEDGRSPPPFTERIPTYDVKIENGKVWVRAEANPPGTPTAPAVIGTSAA